MCYANMTIQHTYRINISGSHQQSVIQFTSRHHYVYTTNAPIWPQPTQHSDNLFIASAPIHNIYIDFQNIFNDLCTKISFYVSFPDPYFPPAREFYREVPCFVYFLLFLSRCLQGAEAKDGIIFKTFSPIKKKSRFFCLALLFKLFFIKIQPNMSEQEKKRQRIYDLLNAEILK